MNSSTQMQNPKSHEKKKSQKSLIMPSLTIIYEKLQKDLAKKLRQKGKEETTIKR